MNRGIWYAVAAYVIWGLLPIFWKSLSAVPAVEILGQRMVWSLLFALILLAIRRHWSWIRPAVADRRTLLTSVATASLLAVNWMTYVWAVNAGYIVETSLGYFINPLIYVVLGVLFLRERPRAWQWAAVALALVGVLYLTVSSGTLPWIALTLALTFAFYGLLRKTARLNALEGLALETGIMFLPAILFLVAMASRNQASFGTSPSTSILLAMTGLATGLPLLLFAMGARLINLSTIGFLQYIAPTCQLLLGVWVYDEAFSLDQLIGFSLVWISLLIYTVEGVVHHRRRSWPASADGLPADIAAK